jgi:hypothetical protein
MKTMKTKPEQKEEEPKFDETAIIDLLLKQVNKPKNCSKINVKNVFDNRFRINIWTTNLENGIEISKIEKSYFAKLIDNNLVI